MKKPCSPITDMALPDDVVEKVARAVYAALVESSTYVGKFSGDSTVLDGQFNLNAVAKAAIATVLEQAELAVYRQKIEGGKNDLIWNPACDACASAIRALAPSEK